MGKRKISKFIAVIVVVALCGCTGAGPGAPPLEKLAMLPIQMLALPFMILRPFAPLIQAGMQAGMQMAPYALLFCQSDTGPSEFVFAGYNGKEEDELVPSLTLIEACLSKRGGVERIVAIDLMEIGGIDNLEILLSAMEKNGVRYRCVIADAGDIIFDHASLDRLKEVLLENGVSLCATGRLSATIADRIDSGCIGFETDSGISRAWHEIAMTR